MEKMTKSKPRKWTKAENAAAIAVWELAGKPYVLPENHRENLMEILDRNQGSIDRRIANFWTLETGKGIEGDITTGSQIPNNVLEAMITHQVSKLLKNFKVLNKEWKAYDKATKKAKS